MKTLHDWRLFFARVSEAPPTDQGSVRELQKLSQPELDALLTTADRDGQTLAHLLVQKRCPQALDQVLTHLESHPELKLAGCDLVQWAQDFHESNTGPAATWGLDEAKMQAIADVSAQIVGMVQAFTAQAERTALWRQMQPLLDHALTPEQQRQLQAQLTDLEALPEFVSYPDAGRRIGMSARPFLQGCVSPQAMDDAELGELVDTARPALTAWWMHELIERCATTSRIPAVSRNAFHACLAQRLFEFEHPWETLGVVRGPAPDPQILLAAPAVPAAVLNPENQALWEKVASQVQRIAAEAPDDVLKRLEGNPFLGPLLMQKLSAEPAVPEALQAVSRPPSGSEPQQQQQMSSPLERTVSLPPLPPGGRALTGAPPSVESQLQAPSRFL